MKQVPLLVMDNVCIVKQLKSVFQHVVTINEIQRREKKNKQKIAEINKNVCYPKGEIIHTVSIR